MYFLATLLTRSISLNDKLLQATGPTVVLSRQYSYKTGCRSTIASYPAYRYARDVECCMKVRQ